MTIYLTISLTLCLMPCAFEMVDVFEIKNPFNK